MFGASGNSPSATFETEHPYKARSEDQSRKPREPKDVSLHGDWSEHHQNAHHLIRPCPEYRTKVRTITGIVDQRCHTPISTCRYRPDALIL